MVETDVLQMLWKDTCTVKILEEYLAENRSTQKRETVLYSDIPCKLSFYNSMSANPDSRKNKTDVAFQTAQTVKLFLSPEYRIPNGSRIEVTHSGVTTLYGFSSQPELFTNHQEILLEKWEKWV